MSDHTIGNSDNSEKVLDGENGAVKQAESVRSLLNLITQKTRFTLIQNIVAHPEGMPSLKEFVYANPSKSKSTIRNHLDKLIDANVVEVVELPEEQRTRDLPHKFYRLSTWGEEFIKDHDLVRAEETLQEMHSMLEKTPQIQRYIEAPRPSDNEDDDKGDKYREALKP